MTSMATKHHRALKAFKLEVKGMKDYIRTQGNLSTQVALDEKSVQVITIGNICGDARLDSFWEPFERIQAIQTPPKALFWQTPYGRPNITILPEQVSDRLLIHYTSLLGEAAIPTLVVPEEASEGILCECLLSDEFAKQQLITSLDKHRPVYLAPFLWTDGVYAVSQWLLSAGFMLAEEWQADADFAALTRMWHHKSYFSQVCKADRHLLMHRPPTFECANWREVLDAINALAGRPEFNQAVIKTDSGAGGFGVYWVPARIYSTVSELRRSVEARGNPVPLGSPPFVVEGRVGNAANLAPTVDLYIREPASNIECDIVLSGAVLQIMIDGRQSVGGMWDPAFRQTRWFATVCELSYRIGKEASRRGYRGPMNLDFVVTPQGYVYIMESNPRRSMQTDAFGLAERISEENSALSLALCTEDFIEVTGDDLSSSNALIDYFETMTRAMFSLVVSEASYTSCQWHNQVPRVSVLLLDASASICALQIDALRRNFGIDVNAP